MVTEQIVALLITERDRLNRAIEALQGPTKRRGRPPKNPLTVDADAEAAEAPAPVATVRKRSRRSAAQRKLQGERMRAYWKKRKAEEAKKA
jgi:hypothetical protein